MTTSAFPLPDEFNAASYFIDRHINEGRGEKIAIECEERRVTYRQLLEAVNKVGNALTGAGVRIEERVFLLLLDTPEFAACFFGAIKMGAVAVPVNTLLKPADYEFLLNNSRARVAIVSASLLPQLHAIPSEKLLYLQKIIIVGESERPGMPGFQAQSFDSWIGNASASLECARTSKDDAALWLFSSGSTGRPKGCVHLQHDMVVCTERYARGILNVTESDRFFSVAKLFFAYGLGNGLYFSLAVGATSILLPGPPKPQTVFDVVERYRPTLFFSVPSNYAKLLAHLADNAPAPDFSSVRHAVSAGECLPAAIFHRFKERFGVEILDAIGSTEALHMFIANRPGAVKPGSSGTIIPGFEARIVDENSLSVATGEMGDLIIKTDAACASYWNQHERTKDTISGQWLRTGDRYYQDSDGYFWYAGRSDDMLKVSGTWVSPVEVENHLMEHPDVQEAAVVGRKDEDGLVKTVACVVLRNERLGSPDVALELQRFILERLPVFKRPHRIDFFSELPKTATGKLQRYKLR
ncbi:MAG: benzoate-CoA ligase family protein [Acidobacteria bacterium]|nr:MAG: benzoate-CoA ligase family protein [Acidobacteriota bacterium]